MNALLRVFLCSTFADLAEERKFVLDAIRKLQLQHDSMEYFGANAKLPIETCLEEVRKSDVLVVIIGHRYGNLVPGRKISFSEAEYREGHSLGKPCLVYIRNESVPVLPKHVERDPKKISRLDKWKVMLSRRHTTCMFDNANELALQVTADLSRTIQNLQPPAEQEEPANAPYVSSIANESIGDFRSTIADLERSYDLTLEALGDALDLKDAETEGHSKRVTAFTIAIARAMGISVKDIRVIARGAFLHDIGKMAIPDGILRKPGSLTPEETAILREHCFRGYQMVKKIPFLEEAAEIVYAHQERFDGTGYPRGLRGEEIPLGARIFSVADCLDAITSDRPYRAAQPLSVARVEIERFSGRSYDPKVVNTFLRIPETLWEDLRQEINSQSNRFTYPLKAPPNEALTKTPVQILAELEAQRNQINLKIKKIRNAVRGKSRTD